MNAPLRRLLAFGIDYVVIAAYLLILATASLVALATPVGPIYKSIWSNAWSAELTGFLFLTTPVILYFAVFESSHAGATLGKRVLHLRVLGAEGGRLGFGRSLVRSSAKFLPWELAHFTIWHYVYGAAGHASPPSWTTLTLAAVYVLVALYLLSLFIGRQHRTIYDRLSGSRVTVLGAAADPSISY